LNAWTGTACPTIQTTFQKSRRIPIVALRKSWFSHV
jgi:hypothetical protein